MNQPKLSMITNKKQLPAAVIEYIEARNAYEEAKRPPNGFGFPRQLKFNDPILLRYRKARADLDHLYQQEKESIS